MQRLYGIKMALEKRKEKIFRAPLCVVKSLKLGEGEERRGLRVNGGAFAGYVGWLLVGPSKRNTRDLIWETGNFQFRKQEVAGQQDVSCFPCAHDRLALPCPNKIQRADAVHSDERTCKEGR